MSAGLLGLLGGGGAAAPAGRRYSPEFEIRINGDPVPAALRANVTSVRYEDGRNAADRVELGIANVDLQWLQEHIRGLGFRPYPTGVRLGPITTHVGGGALFDMDNALELSMGYAGGPLEPMFEGNVTGIQASFPSGGLPTMTLVAHDRMERLSRGKYARGFGAIHDLVVAAILSAENLLIPQIDPAVVGIAVGLAALDKMFSGTGRKQKGQSDLEVMKSIADEYDADFWVEGNTLYFARFFPKSYTPALTLQWGQSLLEFSPRVSTAGAVVGVGLKVNLREIRLDFLISVYWDFDRETLGISVVPAAAAKGAKKRFGDQWTFMDRSIKSAADVGVSAVMLTRELRKRLNSRLTGSGSAVGDPRIRAGEMVRLEGMGPDFSGDYRVTSATHTIDAGGYRTSFEVAKEIIP